MSDLENGHGHASHRDRDRDRAHDRERKSKDEKTARTKERGKRRPFLDLREEKRETAPEKLKRERAEEKWNEKKIEWCAHFLIFSFKEGNIRGKQFSVCQSD